MDARRWEAVRAAFDEVVELGEAERASRLATIGRTDPELRDAVDALLSADADADARLAPVESPLGFAPNGEGTRARSAVVDVQPRLQTALGAAYRIERELGGGGMSHVYLAEETAFRRNVVVKVLRPELAEAISAKRFQRGAHTTGFHRGSYSRDQSFVASASPTMCPFRGSIFSLRPT